MMSRTVAAPCVLLSALAWPLASPVSAAPLQAAPTWQHVMNGELRDAHAWIDPADPAHYRVWTCEDGARIRYRESGAPDWVFQSTPSTARSTLLDIYVDKGVEGWACGRDGLVLASPSATGPWSQLPVVFDPAHPLDGATLWGVRFADASTGWLAGEHILRRTSDGGTTWDPVTLMVWGTEVDYEFYALEFVPGNDRQRLVVGAEPGSAFYSDDGDKWYPADFFDVNGVGITLDPGFEPWDIVFEPNTSGVDNAVGYIVGGVGSHNGSVFRTTDGGVTWHQESLAPSNGETFYGGHAWSGGNALACGYGGHIYKRATNGVWSLVSPSGGAQPCNDTGPFTAPLIGIAGDDAGTVWVVGSFGYLRKATDGGASAASFVSDTTHEYQFWRINDSAFTSASDGWVVGQVGIHRTTDGGASWTPELCSFNVTWLGSIALRSTGNAVAAGDPKFSSSPSAWWRDPLTMTWSAVTDADLTGSIHSVEWQSGATYWAVGDNNKVYRVTNDGVDWELLNGPGGSNANLSCATIYDTSTLFVVGQEGNVGKAWRATGLAGTTLNWVDVSPLIANEAGTWLRSVDARGALPFVDVYAAGHDGVVLRYKRTLDRFEAVNYGTPTDEVLKSIVCVEGSPDVWAAGDFGTMLRFNGSTWSSVKCETSKSVRSLTFPTPTVGFGIGVQNTISVPGHTGDAILIGYH